ncbi:MAG TPA: aldehyde dehydrogenase family protein [Blastocatellia bacterium]|nr:aldehyde dehydrogenase family protein [Blastocatellia bacterium]
MSSDRQAVEQAEQLVERASEAQKVLGTLPQEKIDAILSVIARAALTEAYRLGEMAHHETGYGIPSDKYQKNRFAAEDVYNFIKPIRTVGVVKETDSVIEVASPRGVVAGIIPSTNPTSTAIFKILIAIKARDAIVLSPHPTAINCINETARVMREAGEAAGLPSGAIGCMTAASLEGTQALMKHKRTALILATGGMGLVRAAYSSGKPAFGVGPGNVPAMIERSADIGKAVKDILTGKCFDNGTICSSEQAVVVERSIEPQVKQAFVREGAYFLAPGEQDKLVSVVATEKNTLNSKIVGKSAKAIAEMAGIALPDGIRAMMCHLDGVGKDYPLSMEKLSPILAYYVVENLDEGCGRAAEILRFGGMGHTASVHTRSREAAREYGVRMPVSRVVVNSPSTHGAIGFSTDLEPSMTLGCGSWGGNVTSDNISPRHLLDLKRIAFETKPINKPTEAGSGIARAVASGSAAGRGPQGFNAPVATASTGATASEGNGGNQPAIDRESIGRLVDRFLAEHGISRRQAQKAPSNEQAAQTPPAAEPPAAVVSPQAVQEAGPGPGPAATRSGVSMRSTSQSAPRVAEAVESNGRVYDFVCEDDVKQALAEGRKIYVNSKTIITPAARDLGEPKAVFARR